MKLLFLGTGAADYNPETDGNTEGYRRNSSALIDGKILIDPGPCVFDAIKTFKVNAENIKYVINTHRHSDHFNRKTLSALQEMGAEFIELEDNKTVQIGGYEIIALKGNHSIPVQHFLIDDGKSRLFYGLDSAWIMYDEIQAIKAKTVDFAVLDATIGFVEGDYRIFEHCSLNMLIEIKKSLTNHIKRLCASHLAKTLHPNHNTVCETLKPYGIEVAFDGLEVEF